MTHQLVELGEEDFLRMCKVVKGHKCQLNFTAETPYTSAPFRIAYLLWILRGDNRLEPLEYYSQHVTRFSDNLTHLRGAYGTRLRNWIGVDQYQEALNKNKDVDQVEDFCKPEGVDQIKRVYDDLNSGRAEASTMILRDPALDFDETKDIPDLLAATFSVTESVLRCTMFCEQIALDGNYVNDVWFFMHLLEMYRGWMLKERAVLEVYSPIARHRHPVDFVKNSPLFGFTVNEKQYNQVFHPDPNVFWTDLELLQKFEMHLRQRFKADVFHNPDVIVAQLHENMVSCLLEKIQNPYLQDMCWSLLVFALTKYGQADKYEDVVMKYFRSIKGGLRVEMAAHLLNKQAFSNLDLQQEMIATCHQNEE